MHAKLGLSKYFKSSPKHNTSSSLSK